MNEKLRIPGEKIASIEEYLPGDNCLLYTSDAADE